MGTVEGFVLGQALAPNYDTGPAWEARAMREQARKEAAEAQVQKLSAALDKEHRRFLIERRERKDYMRSWAVRGHVLRELCGYDDKERRMAAQKDMDEKHDETLSQMGREKDAEIDQMCGF